MRATVLVDNIGSNIGNDTIQGEWGLSFFIEYGEARILLDAGQSALFAENARKLGLSAGRKWTMRCSHLPTTIMRTAWRPFFERNSRAPAVSTRQLQGELLQDQGRGLEVHRHPGRISEEIQGQAGLRVR